MRPSGPISLFSERPPSRPPTVSILVSIFTHALVIGLVALGLMFTPRIDERAALERYEVRHLDLHLPPPEINRPRPPGVPYPKLKSDPAPKPAAAGSSPKPSVARQVAQTTPAPQTLLQPKLRHKILPEKVPVPTVVVWKMETAKNSTIVPPLPKTPTAAVVPPAVDPPNQETRLDNLAISSSLLASKAQPVLPATTSPMVTLAPQQAQEPPQTTSKSTAEPTPAAVVSLSDLRKEGVVVLPEANETASANSSGVLAPGTPEDLAKADTGHEGQGIGASSNPNAAGAGAGSEKDRGSKSGAAGSGAQGANSDVALGSPLTDSAMGSGTVERIALPKDGQFGSVIIGSSLEDTYPEAAELWSGRLAYTVYIHVGLSKSWILQYALLPSAEAALGGNAAHLAAPWPYTIVRPNLPLADANADAIMIHGIVNVSGRFETLAVAFPPKYRQAEFALASLRQWEFRPATQGGRPIPVEILLIIPAEVD
jgi:hypothetical protein